ncbi:hypothetical protein BSPWISOX_118 [uncultured Gammaproteobacteria bacterium]|jgi:hypothetical protein|nr:hypothetical protein BSPCLSOX_2789 [uncultured Gammaproteobacteria bacterium]VVH62769.1 hypothetical protein BSPWISOX_118 [uncultured Gammaproteobacteria bacterium]VVM25659.1 hypothetical protein BSPWISOXPB_7695 [uncultured Gammaproteobacteria bacterium]
MNSWIECLLPILEEYAGRDTLSGDGVDDLCEIINHKLQYHQGNITIDGYKHRMKRLQRAAHWCDLEGVKNINSSNVGVELLIQSLNSFAGKHRIDWDILETVRYSKKGKLIIDLDLLNDIDVYDKFDCLAINILNEFQKIATNG